MINQQRAKSNKLCVQVSSFPFSIVFVQSCLWTFKFVTRIFRESCCFLWFHLLFCAGNWRTAGKKIDPLTRARQSKASENDMLRRKAFRFSCLLLYIACSPFQSSSLLKFSDAKYKFPPRVSDKLGPLSLSLPIFPPNESNLGFKPFWGGTKESIIRPVTCWQRHELMRTSNIQRMIFFFQNFLLASGAFRREKRFPLFIVWI